MSRLVVRAFSVSADGYGAGPNQSLKNPLGEGAEPLFTWAFDTPAFKRVTGHGGDRQGVDADFAERSFENIGAWIMGRNMFGPVRGPWPDESWRGWWGDAPPFHTSVFVLTNHPRASFEIGGTSFHFVTDGIEEAHRLAKTAAGGKDVRLGGGVSTVQDFLRARLVDELHLAVAPMLLGAGENLFAGINLPLLGYQYVEKVASPAATHLVIRKQ